jgi:hypothetical protein
MVSVAGDTAVMCCLRLHRLIIAGFFLTLLVPCRILCPCFQIPHNLDEFSEHEALRDASADLGDRPEAPLHDAAALPPLTGRSGPRRFSKAASGTPSRGTSGGLPSADEGPPEATAHVVDHVTSLSLPGSDMPSPDMPNMEDELPFQDSPLVTERADNGSLKVAKDLDSAASEFNKSEIHSQSQIEPVAQMEHDHHMEYPVEGEAGKPEKSADQGDVAAGDEAAGVPIVCEKWSR